MIQEEKFEKEQIKQDEDIHLKHRKNISEKDKLFENQQKEFLNEQDLQKVEDKYQKKKIIKDQKDQMRKGLIQHCFNFFGLVLLLSGFLLALYQKYVGKNLNEIKTLDQLEKWYEYRIFQKVDSKNDEQFKQYITDFMISRGISFEQLQNRDDIYIRFDNFELKNRVLIYLSGVEIKETHFECNKITFKYLVEQYDNEQQEKLQDLREEHTLLIGEEFLDEKLNINITKIQIEETEKIYLSIDQNLNEQIKIHLFEMLRKTIKKDERKKNILILNEIVKFLKYSEYTTSLYYVQKISFKLTKPKKAIWEESCIKIENLSQIDNKFVSYYFTASLSGISNEISQQHFQKHKKIWNDNYQNQNNYTNYFQLIDNQL